MIWITSIIYQKEALTTLTYLSALINPKKCLAPFKRRMKRRLYKELNHKRLITRLRNYRLNQFKAHLWTLSREQLYLRRGLKTVPTHLHLTWFNHSKSQKKNAQTIQSHHKYQIISQSKKFLQENRKRIKKWKLNKCLGKNFRKQ